jgi:hypothetical protein
MNMATAKEIADELEVEKRQLARKKLKQEKNAIRRINVSVDYLIRDHGWKLATYAPPFVELELIEVGSEGIRTGYRTLSGEFFARDARGDTYPAAAILFRKKRK